MPTTTNPAFHDPRTATLPACSPADAPGIVRHLREDGCVLLPGLIDRATVASIRAAIDALAHLPGDNDHRQRGHNDHHKCVFNRDPFWLRFIDPPGVIDAVEQLMGPDCHIIGMSAWRSWPGKDGDRRGPTGMHADQLFITMDEELLTSGRVELPMFLGTLHYYLDDLSEELCPTWVIPGTHKSGCGPGGALPPGPGHHSTVGGEATQWNGVEAVPVLVPAGTGMLFRSELWHSGSANRTADRCRYLLQVHYAQRGIAQRFPPHGEFRLDPAIMAQASERQARLLGRHRPSAYG